MTLFRDCFAALTLTWSTVFFGLEMLRLIFGFLIWLKMVSASPQQRCQLVEQFVFVTALHKNLGAQLRDAVSRKMFAPNGLHLVKERRLPGEKGVRIVNQPLRQ